MLNRVLARAIAHVARADRAINRKMARVRAKHVAATLLPFWLFGCLVASSTVYGPTASESEALNAGIVLVILDRACVGFEWYGDVGIFAGLNNDDGQVCA